MGLASLTEKGSIAPLPVNSNYSHGRIKRLIENPKIGADGRVDGWTPEDGSID